MVEWLNGFFCRSLFLIPEISGQALKGSVLSNQQSQTPLSLLSHPLAPSKQVIPRQEPYFCFAGYDIFPQTPVDDPGFRRGVFG